MSSIPSFFGMDNLIRSYALRYSPMTDWRRFISPTIVFGNANIADSATEQKAVDRVGSDGFSCRRTRESHPS